MTLMALKFPLAKKRPVNCASYWATEPVPFTLSSAPFILVTNPFDVILMHPIPQLLTLFVEVNQMNAIDVQNLTRHYDEVQAVDNISFTVAPGEIFGFLGPNGAGKSTTIKMLTGQLRPSAGKAFVMGCDVVTDRQRLKPQIGVVFEHQNMYERESGRGNLRFFARLYGAEKKRVDEVLAQVGLTELANKKVKKYSNGMKQRLLIARALLHKPKVLFLDEPTRGLDPNVAREIRAIIADLAQRGVTVFLTTHYMEEADLLSHRVAIIDQGHIVALDTPERLKAQNSQNGGDAGPDGKVSLEDVFVALTGRYLGRGGYES
jgi:ABC-2 type transport system ATP-binding protein